MNFSLLLELSRLSGAEGWAKMAMASSAKGFEGGGSSPACTVTCHPRQIPSPPHQEAGTPSGAAVASAMPIQHCSPPPRPRPSIPGLASACYKPNIGMARQGSPRGSSSPPPGVSAVEIRTRERALGEQTPARLGKTPVHRYRASSAGATMAGMRGAASGVLLLIAGVCVLIGVGFFEVRRQFDFLCHFQANEKGGFREGGLDPVLPSREGTSTPGKLNVWPRRTPQRRRSFMGAATNTTSLVGSSSWPGHRAWPSMQ